MPLLKLLNKNIIDVDPWKATLLIYSLIALLFDLYLLAVSENTFLSVVSICCLLIGYLSVIKCIDDGLNFYFLIYLVPGFLMALGAIPNGEALGINSGGFFLSAYATAGSALIPPIATVLTVPLVLVIGGILRYVEKRF